MIRSRVLLGLLLLAVPACASAEGLRVDPPTLRSDASGLDVRGAVCRVSALPTAGVSAVRIERVGGTGQVSDVAYAKVSRSLGGRETGCGFYGRVTGWRLAAGEQVRVCLANSAACPTS